MISTTTKLTYQKKAQTDKSLESSDKCVQADETQVEDDNYGEVDRLITSLDQPWYQETREHDEESKTQQEV